MTSPFLKAATGGQKKSETSVLTATTDASKSVFAPSVLDASPVYAPAAPKAVPTLPTMSRKEIEEVGAEAGLTLRSLNAEVLKHQRSNQGDEMSQRLTALIKQAKQLDPASIKQSKGVGKLIKKLMGMKEDLFGEFDNVNNRIEELVKNLQMDIRKEEDSLVYLDKLHQAIGQYAASLNRDMELLTAAYEQELATFEATPEDAVEARQRVRDTLDLLEIRIADLKALRLLCVQMGPRVLGMQKVSASLMRSARNIVNNVIPAYSANFSMYIESLRQKKAAETQNNVLDEFNLAIKLGSDLATQNQIEAAALANRQVLDIETLRHDQENLVKMLEETNRINTEARAARVDYINEVQSLEDGMVDAVKKGLGK